METKARGQMQPFAKADVEVIRGKLATRNYTRDLALFETAISTMLRGADLVGLKVGDVTDRSGVVLETFHARQRKTRKAVAVHLSNAARAALRAHITANKLLQPDAYLFQRDDRAAGTGGAALTTTSYRTLVKRWADLAGYADARRFSGHSTRRTKAAILYRETRDVEAVRRLLGHASLAHTCQYLGVGNDEALALAARYEV